jgi:predicted transcriptional regulator
MLHCAQSWFEIAVTILLQRLQKNYITVADRKFKTMIVKQYSQKETIVQMNLTKFFNDKFL